MKSVRYFLSRCRVFCPEKEKNKLISTLLSRAVPFYDTKVTDGGFFLSVSTYDYEKNADIFSLCNIEKKDGAFVFLKKKKHRIGLFFGAVFCIVCLFVSSKFIWAIEVQDTGNLTSEEIKALLSEAGLGVGAYIPSLDTELISIKVLMNTRELSYLTININGNVARVISAQRDENLNKDESASVSNLIASEDGQIVRQELYSGSLIHKNGDIIKKGELLISGLYESPRLGVKAVRASGKVYAEINRNFEIFYPRIVYEKTYTGKESIGKTLLVFGSELTLSRCNDAELFDDEATEKPLTVLGTVKLPIVMKTTKRREFSYIKREFDENETMKRAMEEYEQKLAEMSIEGELTQKSFKIISDDTGCKITCSVSLIKDITTEVFVSSEQERPEN